MIRVYLCTREKQVGKYMKLLKSPHKNIAYFAFTYIYMDFKGPLCTSTPGNRQQSISDHHYPARVYIKALNS